MRAAIYTRVSTERQANEGASLDDQLARLRTWAQQLGATVVREFIEPGSSAYDDRRPVFDQMIETAMTRPAPFDAILVFAFTRFYRDNVKRELCVQKLERNRVVVLSVTEPLPEEEASKVLLRNIFGIIGEWQSRDNSKHTTACLRANAERGFWNGSIPPFGYKVITTDIPARSGHKKRLAINPEEAETVRLIFNLATDGLDGRPLGIKKIASHLNDDRGLKIRGKLWRKQAVDVVLRNAVYIGKYVCFKRNARSKEARPESEWITYEVPAIIDQATFEKAGSALSSRNIHMREAKASLSPTLLTGLLKCARCGKSLNLMTGKSGRYNYYRCGTRLNSSAKGCDCPNVPKEEFDELVRRTIAKELLNSERLTAILEDLRLALRKSAEPDLKRMQAAQRAAALQTERIAALYEQISSGTLSLDGSLKEFVRDQQNKLATLQSEIDLLARRQQLPLRKFGVQQIEEFAIAAQDALLGPNSKLARGYLLATVSEIRIGPAEAEIKGSRAQLAAAIAAWKPETIPSVPSFVSNWRARQDSNLLPPA